MRIKYMGMDGRVRVAKANRVKFLEDGFRKTDSPAEQDDLLKGPLLIAHVYRSKGGKRVTMHVPEGFDAVAAQTQLLEQGWADLTACIVKNENLYI